MKYLLSLLILIALLFPSQTNAQNSCVCNKNVRYEHAFKVHIDSVVKIGSDYVARGKKLETYEGYQNPEIEVRTQVGNCEILFQKDAEYLVYARVDAEGRLRTDACSGSEMVTETTKYRSNPSVTKTTKTDGGNTMFIIITIIIIAGALLLVMEQSKKK